jgi:hypothetical protein
MGFAELWRLNREFRRLDPPAPRRVKRAVGRGEVLPSRGEAALAVALARENLNLWRASLPPYLVLFALWLAYVLVRVVLSAEHLFGWGDVVLALIGIAGAVTHLRQVPRWKRAERLNRFVVDPDEGPGSGPD